MFASVAVTEEDTALAFQFIDRGYAQCRHSVLCPVCGKKYLVLVDRDVCEVNASTKEAAIEAAVSYFSTRFCQTHETGHREKQLTMVQDIPH